MQRSVRNLPTDHPAKSKLKTFANQIRNELSQARRDYELQIITAAGSKSKKLFHYVRPNDNRFLLPPISSTDGPLEDNPKLKLDLINYYTSNFSTPTPFHSPASLSTYPPTTSSITSLTLLSPNILTRPTSFMSPNPITLLA
eukprot:GHVN01084163.1.p1 GENE.GHVN01084163.1~~GHVN01084163.1.p1  ORF type:complete len:142 (-),score=18.01 GHVN01084163.1:1554-1979(-)